jgi:hypothetical protein
MHSTHCSSVIFPYQALERIPAQVTLIGCTGLHNIKNSKVLNIHPAFSNLFGTVLALSMSDNVGLSILPNALSKSKNSVSINYVLFFFSESIV